MAYWFNLGDILNLYTLASWKHINNIIKHFGAFINRRKKKFLNFEPYKKQRPMSNDFVNKIWYNQFYIRDFQLEMKQKFLVYIQFKTLINHFQIKV